jgi:hypothetical protein
MPTVTVYASTDGSAPVLTGAVGSLNSLLDACLVSGYGAKSAAGWTKPYTGTNKAVFRINTTDGTGLYLNVDDSAPGAGGAREALMTGFETMSSVGTGTGQFPTAGQLALGSAPSGAVVCRKSTTADATARAWTLVASSTFFYLFTETGDFTNPAAPMAFGFGDIFSYKASDAYRTIIIGRNNVNTGAVGSEAFSGLLNMAAGASATIAGHFMPRSWTALGTSTPVGKNIDYFMTGNATFNAGNGTSGTTSLSSSVPGIGLFASGAVQYPNPVDGGLYLSPIRINHGGAIRGYLPGAWCPVQDRPLNHNDTYSGTGNLSGKTFLVQGIVCSGGSVVPATIGQVHIETSSTWG